MMSAKLEVDASGPQPVLLVEIATRVSVSVTVAPRRTSSSAAATPLRAAPTTVTRLPRDGERGMRSSSQFQRRQAEQRKDDGDESRTA